MIRTSSLFHPKSRLLRAMLMLALIASSPYVLRAADGALDFTFGKEGKVRTDFVDGSYDVGFGVAVQADGKTVAVGTAVSPVPLFAVARYNRDGSLDQTFGDGGKVVTAFRDSDFAMAVAVQRNGKIVVAGLSMSADSLQHPDAFAVARYNRDGSLDLTFGDGGKVLTTFPNAYSQARAIAIQADGRIVVVGQAVGPSGFTADIAVARYAVNGALDASFGSGGTVVVSVDEIDDARAVAVPFDGRIVIAGSTRPLSSSEDFAVLRLNRDGSLDQTFGAGGIVRTDPTGQQDVATGVMIQRNGKIVVAGSATGAKSLGFGDAVLVRYDRDGSLDSTFGTAGIAVADLAGFDDVMAAALQADGKIVVGSTSGGLITVARFNTDGSADSTFGSNGVAQADFATPDEDPFDSLSALAIQPDGRIVAAGTTWNYFTTGESNFALARFEASASAPPLPR